MAGAEPHDDDEFPPRRPFGVPPRPPAPEPDDDDAGDGETPRPAAGPSLAQPPATPS